MDPWSAISMSLEIGLLKTLFGKDSVEPKNVPWLSPHRPRHYYERSTPRRRRSGNCFRYGRFSAALGMGQREIDDTRIGFACWRDALATAFEATGASLSMTILLWADLAGA
jgi:hypothetical protein